MEATNQGATTDSHVEGSLVVEGGEKFTNHTNPLFKSLLWLKPPFIPQWKVMLTHQTRWQITLLIVLLRQSMALMLLFGELQCVKPFLNSGSLELLLRTLL